MIIAVDFDGTLRLPDGKANLGLIEDLRARQMYGAAVILWTCREGERLREAVRFCNRNGLFFAAVNANVPEGISRMGHDSRKVFADVYIDDKGLR